jgi:hypothetical protein
LVREKVLSGLIVRFADYTLMWFLWTAYPQDRRNGRTSQNRLLDKIEVLVGQPGSSDSHPPLKLLLDRSSSLRQNRLRWSYDRYRGAVFDESSHNLRHHSRGVVVLALNLGRITLASLV